MKPTDKQARSRQQRSAARLYAVQALFQMEALGAAADRVAREFETHRFGAEVDGSPVPGEWDAFLAQVGPAYGRP